MAEKSIELSKEMVRADIEKITKNAISGGLENKKDAAAVAMQSFEVLKRGLRNPEMIKLLYTPDTAEAEERRIIPKIVCEIAKQSVEGNIAEQEAIEKLQGASKKYSDAFKEMGITFLNPPLLSFRR